MEPNPSHNTHHIERSQIALDTAEILKMARAKPDTSNQVKLEALIEEACTVAKPKALYQVAYIEDRTDDSVTINDVTFTSRILKVNLDQAERVFVWLATCGEELDRWSAQFDNLLTQFWADLIKQSALFYIRDVLLEHIEENYRPGKISSMSPGSLEDWPITQQQPLFTLLDGAHKTIGMYLTESCLMVPTKSLSGILFPTEFSFESCQLCTRPNCQGRRAAYKPTLWEKYN